MKEKHYTIVSGSSMWSSNLSSSAEAEQQDAATHFVSPMFNSLHSRFNNQHRPQFPPEIVINLDSGDNYQEESSSSGGGNAADISDTVDGDGPKDDDHIDFELNNDDDIKLDEKEIEENRNIYYCSITDDPPARPFFSCNRQGMSLNIVVFPDLSKQELWGRDLGTAAIE